MKFPSFLGGALTEKVAKTCRLHSSSREIIPSSRNERRGAQPQIEYLRRRSAPWLFMNSSAGPSMFFPQPAIITRRYFACDQLLWA